MLRLHLKIGSVSLPQSALIVKNPLRRAMVCAQPELRLTAKA